MSMLQFTLVINQDSNYVEVTRIEDKNDICCEINKLRLFMFHALFCAMHVHDEVDWVFNLQLSLQFWKKKKKKIIFLEYDLLCLH